MTPRTRTIKYGFYINDELAECSLAARFILPGIWMLADREGRLEYRPKKIKGLLMPYDNVDIESLLEELVQAGFLITYVVNEKRYIWIPNFKKHQKVHPKEEKSSLPPCPYEYQGSTQKVPCADQGNTQASPEQDETDADQDESNTHTLLEQDQGSTKVLPRCYPDTTHDESNADQGNTQASPEQDETDADQDESNTHTLLEQDQGSTKVLPRCYPDTTHDESNADQGNTQASPRIPSSSFSSLSSFKNTSYSFCPETSAKSSGSTQEQGVLFSEAETPKARDKPVITLPLNDGTEFPITQDDVEEWSKLYPDVSIEGELRRMRGWLLANAKKTKRGIRRFANQWLDREQNKPHGTRGGNDSSENSHSALAQCDL